MQLSPERQGESGTHAVISRKARTRADYDAENVSGHNQVEKREQLVPATSKSQIQTTE